MLAISIRNLDLQCTVASMAVIGLIPAIITQVQRRAEELLVSERNFFRSSLDQAPEGIIVLGLDGELLDINQSGLKLLHFSSIEEARSAGIESRLSHLAWTEHMKMVGIVRSGAEHLHDFLIENRNKPRRQIESRAVALRQPNGDIYATLSIWRDVTDERRFHSELKVARFTVDHATVPLLWISRQGRVVDTNQSACLLLGYPRGELLVLHSKDISTDFSENRWNKLWSEIAEKRTADFEATLRHKSGRSINAELRSHYIDLDLGGEHRELVCVFLTDVTEKRRAIELIRRNEERLALIFGAVAEGIVVYDGNEKIIEANPSAWQILGGTNSGNLEKLQQKLVWQFLDEPTQETDQDVDPLSFTFRTGKPTRGLLRILARDDGSLRCLSVSTQPLLNDKGTVELVISSFSDITAQRSMQEQLRRSQKMVIFGQLAGGIAHDFNNILTAMGFSLKLLDETISSESEEGQLICNLRSMTKRASGLTEQLLLFARHRVVQMKKIDLNANVSSLTKILMPALGERINLSMRLHPRPIWIEGDSGMIDQVIMNLCVNARDAIGSMGTITITTEVGTSPQGFNLKTRMGSPTIGPFALLRISDTGCGMSEKILERIFEPFYTTKETGKGTGLGLATVHGILEQHHAWATVESIVGKGTVFSVYISLSDDPHKKLEQEKPNCSGEGQTILLVEDEELVRMLCSTLLENAGYKVLAARDGNEAMRVWNSNKDAIKILVTDMVLPGGITGLELIEKLRQQSPELCAVLVSGYNEEVLKTEEFSEIGITLLPKPFEISSLTQAISTKLRSQACPIDANMLIR